MAVTRKLGHLGIMSDFSELDCTVDLKIIKKIWTIKNIPTKQKAPEFRELLVWEQLKITSNL